MKRATRSKLVEAAPTAGSSQVRPRGRRMSKPDVVALKRQGILEVASRLFHEKGYETATLDMVADELNVTKPYLYTYYKNKAEILASVCAVGVSESLDALDRAAAAPGNSVDQLRAALREVAAIIIDRMEYIVVYQREMKNLTNIDAQQILRLRHEFDLRIARLVEQCRADGLVTLHDAAAMSVWMGGLLSWIPNCYWRGSRRKRDDVIEQVSHACMRLIGLD
ncbi:TetR family transcriptional regulator [Sphingosinicella microcystinivorans]|uniref:TetR family transcriptional regulator n=2 Tax=Sphingosinicella microcystinivorans TaxID=335406 RepID=A0ABX9T2B6_SPHMI|nr:TetR family transcriptional regulator [Sphingosinicella microcystinivorans]